MSHLGYGLGTIGAFPGEDILLRGAFKAFIAGGKLALTNPKTTAAGAAIATGTTTTDAEAGTRANILRPKKMRDLPFEEYTQSEVDEAVKAFKEGKPKKRIRIDLNQPRYSFPKIKKAIADDKPEVLIWERAFG